MGSFCSLVPFANLDNTNYQQIFFLDFFLSFLSSKNQVTSPPCYKNKYTSRRNPQLSLRVLSEIEWTWQSRLSMSFPQKFWAGIYCFKVVFPECFYRESRKSKLVKQITANNSFDSAQDGERKSNQCGNDRLKNIVFLRNDTG